MGIDPTTGMWVNDVFHGSPGPGNSSGWGTATGMYNIMQANKLYDQNESNRLLQTYLAMGKNPEEIESLLNAPGGQEMIGRLGMAPDMARSALEPWHRYQEDLQAALAEGTPEAYTRVAVQHPLLEKGVLGPMASIMKQRESDTERWERQTRDLNAKQERLTDVLKNRKDIATNRDKLQALFKLIAQGYTPDQAVQIIDAQAAGETTGAPQAPVAKATIAQREAHANEYNARAGMLKAITQPTVQQKLAQAGLASANAALKSFLLAYQKDIGAPLDPNKVMADGQRIVASALAALRNPKLDAKTKADLQAVAREVPQMIQELFTMSEGGESEEEPGPPTDRDIMGHPILPQQKGAGPQLSPKAREYLEGYQ